MKNEESSVDKTVMHVESHAGNGHARSCKARGMCRPLLLIFHLSLFLLIPSCTADDYEYSSHQCYLIIDNSTHLDATLSSALVQLSPGVFCRIYTPGDSYFYFESNQGLSSKSAMNAVDKQRTMVIGVNNGSGIIVGYGTLNYPATLYAFDRQCPNCYEETGLPRYGLTMSDAGIATCSSCQRTYDMNNGGIVASGATGGDKKMFRYRVSYVESTRVLFVNN